VIRNLKIPQSTNKLEDLIYASTWSLSSFQDLCLSVIKISGLLYLHMYLYFIGIRQIAFHQAYLYQEEWRIWKSGRKGMLEVQEGDWKIGTEYKRRKQPGVSFPVSWWMIIDYFLHLINTTLCCSSSLKLFYASAWKSHFILWHLLFSFRCNFPE